MKELRAVLLVEDSPADAEMTIDALRDSGEAEATERAHAAYMMVLAEEETLEMHPAQREAWLVACDAEHDNFRAAIHHLVTTGQAEWALRLAGALFRFWEQREHLSEAQDTLARVLAMPAAQAPTPQLVAWITKCSSLGPSQSSSTPSQSLSVPALPFAQVSTTVPPLHVSWPLAMHAPMPQLVGVGT